MDGTSLTREQVREVDHRAINDFGLPGIVLMENAGRGTAEWMTSAGVRGRVVVCAGKGNNGGDGFVVARHLDNCGIDVAVVLVANPRDLAADAAINYRVIESAGIPIHSGEVKIAEIRREFEDAAWIVDALLGTGTTGRVREPFESVIDAINGAPGRVLAIDLPSGLDCDTGKPLGACVKAHETITFVARKSGFDNPESHEFTGAVSIVDIGAPRVILDQLVSDLNNR